MIALKKLLIIEDDIGLQTQMRWCLNDEISITVAADKKSALAELRKHDPQVVLLDLGLPPASGNPTVGFELLEEIRLLSPKVKIIIMTGQDQQQYALKALHLGAFDYFPKPVAGEKIQFIVERAFKHIEWEAQDISLEVPIQLEGIHACCEPMLSLIKIVQKIASSPLTALILGETGTGKELIAQAIRKNSNRKDQPFYALNCAAIPENLLESELFGFEKGAFTGAIKQKKGKIEQAHTGILFLDEIGDMPMHLQAKLLRFLQEREFERVGGDEIIQVDVRIISATHRDLHHLIETGSFREDLFYRLNEVVIKVPALRDRKGDISYIAHKLLEKYASVSHLAIKSFSEEALTAMENYEWPGNIRELENKIKCAILLAEGNRITVSDLELPLVTQEVTPFNLREVRDKAEKTAIIQALQMAGHNIAEASRALGITRPTLYNLLSKYKIMS